MNNLLIIAEAVLLSTVVGYSQGTFIPANFSAPTRIGSAEGPLANWDYYGQFLAGATPDTLFPVDIPHPHYDGVVSGPTVPVPGIPCREAAYVQMVAWNWRYWGQFLENVPLNQLGRTDIVLKGLAGCDGQVESAPRFTQPAIIPPIPEPSTALLGLLAGSLLVAGCLVRRRRSS